MKRISLLSTLLLSILCSYAQATDFYHVPIRYRTRWSPYSQSLVSGFVEYNPNALSYKSNGLVNHRLEYSPYAFGLNSNGLVDRDLEYNPYAFGINSSGLIPQTSPDYYTGGTVLNIVHKETCACENQTTFRQNISTGYPQKTKEQRVSERKDAIETQKLQIEKNKQKKNNDPSEAIREYLNCNNISFRTNRTLRIDGKTVSINFNIEETNIIIKFWNLKAATELTENDKLKKKIFDNYMESWEEYCLNNSGTKQVFNIISDDKEEILEMLASNEIPKSKDVLYASAMNQN